MKKGICLGCVPGDNVESKLQLAHDAGFDGVEIGACDDDQEVMALKQHADDIGLKIHGIMGGKHWSHPLSDPDPAIRQVCRQSIEQSLRHARLIGSDTVLLVPAVVTEAVTYEQAWQRSLEQVVDLARVAQQEGVCLALENVWNRFLLSPIEFVTYLNEIGSSHVKLYFDCGNILDYGFPQHWIRSLGPQIAKIHVKGFNTFPKTGFPHALESDVPWAACREAWQEIGYDDYLTVEISPDPAEPVESIHRYRQQLDQIIAGKLA